MPNNMIKVLTYLTIALLALVSVEALAHGVDDNQSVFRAKYRCAVYSVFIHRC